MNVLIKLSPTSKLIEGEFPISIIKQSSFSHHSVTIYHLFNKCEWKNESDCRLLHLTLKLIQNTAKIKRQDKMCNTYKSPA